MKKLTRLMVALSLLFLFSGISQAAGGNSGKPNPHPGQDTEAATPNLSFPVIVTDVIEGLYAFDENGNPMFDTNGKPIPIVVTEAIADDYVGIYPGNEDNDYTEYVLNIYGCADGTTGSIPMLDWLESMEPWYPQLATTLDGSSYDNRWQAEREMASGVVQIDFIDWGNPMENINPIVGYRFPVEVALYTKLDVFMTAYKMACLEYPASRDEVFGTSAMGAVVVGENGEPLEDENGDEIPEYTEQVYYATVLTNQFTAEVENPDGTSASINLAPGIGPSGKMNFASAGGGWIPTMPGWHRIWLRLSDSRISFADAIVNNDEHYVMTSSECDPAEMLSDNKLELSGIVGNSTYIDVLVVKPSGKKKK